MSLNKNLNMIIVLDDGETFCALRGARIVCLTDKQMEMLGEGQKVRHLEEENETVSSIDLVDFLSQDPHFEDFEEECNTIAEQMDWVEEE